MHALCPLPSLQSSHTYRSGPHHPISKPDIHIVKTCSTVLGTCPIIISPHPPRSGCAWMHCVPPHQCVEAARIFPVRDGGGTSVIGPVRKISIGHCLPDCSLLCSCLGLPLLSFAAPLLFVDLTVRYLFSRCRPSFSRPLPPPCNGLVNPLTRSLRNPPGVPTPVAPFFPGLSTNHPFRLQLPRERTANAAICKQVVQMTACMLSHPLEPVALTYSLPQASWGSHVESKPMLGLYQSARRASISDWVYKCTPSLQLAAV